MVPAYKTIIGLSTLAIGLVSYSFYYRDIFRGKTKPDGFSWLIWALLAAITFFAQRANGAGPGSWATALTALACFSISVTAFLRDTAEIKKIKTLDSSSLAGAVLSIGVWKYTSDPLLAVILVIVIGAFGFVPTYKKAFLKPHQETLATYSLNALKFCLAIFGLQSFSPVTWLYPAAMTAMNVFLALIIAWRGKFNP